MPLRILRSLGVVLAMVQATPCAVGALGGPPPARQATETVTATVTFAPRTSLQVSRQVLQFEVTDRSVPAESSVDFTAGGRTRHGSDVLLVLQVDESMTSPAGATAGALTIVGGTAGTIAGTVPLDAPVVVARWPGSGLRSGRLTFRLHAAPGRYEIPIRFLVTLSDGA